MSRRLIVAELNVAPTGLASGGTPEIVVQGGVAGAHVGVRVGDAAGGPEGRGRVARQGWGGASQQDRGVVIAQSLAAVPVPGVQQRAVSEVLFRRDSSVRRVASRGFSNRSRP